MKKIRHFKLKRADSTLAFCKEMLIPGNSGGKPPVEVPEQIHFKNAWIRDLYFPVCIVQLSLLNNRMVTGVVGPGGIWGRVQGVGSDHWGTRSQP